jgi:hypothetical protein
MSAEELRSTWQYRALFNTYGVHRAVMLSIIDTSFTDSTELLMTVLLSCPPPYQPPFLCSAARIEKDGGIYAYYVDKWGRKRYGAFFTSEASCQTQFRRLADRLRFDDAERTALFAAINKWIASDRRLDPNFDRADPDAKRLTSDAKRLVMH